MNQPIVKPSSAKASIFSMVMLLITTVIIVFSISIGWSMFNGYNQLIKKEKLAYLSTLAEEKVDRINQYIDRHLDRINILSTMQSTQQAMYAFTRAFHDKGTTSTAYQYANQQYGPFLENFLANWHYYDLFLIDSQGTIIYSIKHESDFGSNLQTGPYQETGLGQVFKHAKNLLQTNNSTFAFYQPSQEPGSFVAAPLIHDGVLLGVVALQFDTQSFYDAINHFSGLGQTGEIVVGQNINNQIVITAPLRHDPDAAFKRTIALNADNARPIRESSSGQVGSGIIRDWRGKEVLAVWKYIPALQWGMVVKIDTQEAFAYTHDTQKNLIGMIALIFLLGYILTYLFTRRLTRPLQQLTETSLAFAQGKSDVQFQGIQNSNTEIGTLSYAFAAMVAQVQQSKSKLENMVQTLAHQNLELDQRVAEQTAHIQAVIENAAEGILTMDTKGNILTINPTTCTIFGYTEQELITLNITDIIPESSKIWQLQSLESWHSPDVEHGQTCNPCEREGLRKSGEVFPMEISINSMQVNEQQLFLAMLRDISHEKREREQLEHTQRLESLGVLAGGIAHDFNNLLTAILGNAALAKTRIEKTSAAAPMLDNIEKSSERAADLCKQMLAYSGKGKFVVEPVNLTHMIDEMMTLLQVSIQKNVVMRLDLAENLPLIEADASQIQQIIMNLVINASEAIENNSGIITVHTGMINIDQDYIKTTYLHDNIQPGRFVTLEVSDTGCGMSSETKSHIFDPFFTTKFTGRGLGMSAILGIVRGHQGAIKLYSELGRGTTFKVLFPCSSNLEALPILSTNEHVHPTKKEGTVLIIDDEESVREIASLMLESFGYSSLTAQDGQEGLVMFKKHQTDISAVLLDMTMPRLDGSETFRELKVLDPNVKVILSSGYNEQDATNRFVGKGLAGFLQKPYTPNALYEKLNTILN